MRAFYVIQQSLGLTAQVPLRFADMEPPLFISIDLEYGPKCITQLGVSTFDSHSLASGELQESISNDFPISSTLYSTKVSRYTERRRKPSHFGEKRVLQKKNLNILLSKILTPTDEQDCLRNVVLVGHAIRNDLDVIRKLCGLDILFDFPSIKAILDTQHMSYILLNSLSILSLKSLLVTLDLDYIGLHNAAHDSRYTLRALLLMLCKPAQQQLPVLRNPEVEVRLAIIERIARFHKPRDRIT